MEPTSIIRYDDKERIKEITSLIDSVFIRQCRVNNWLKYIIRYSKKIGPHISIPQTLHKVNKTILLELFNGNNYTDQEEVFITTCLNGRIRLILEQYIQGENCPIFGLSCYNLICSKLYKNFQKVTDCKKPVNMSNELISTIDYCDNQFDAFCIYEYIKNIHNIHIPYPIFVENYFGTLKTLYTFHKDTFMDDAVKLGIDYSAFGYNPSNDKITEDYLPF